MTGRTTAACIDLVSAHADWSLDSRKRWIVAARRGPDGWRIGAPAPVGDVATLLARLAAAAQGAPVALGLDLPLGVPRAYAERHAARRAADFPSFLRGLAHCPEFFRVAGSLDDIHPERPFYPARGTAGMTRTAHAAALGLENAAALCRACDRATAERPAGAPPFWTLGANQSGKAALHGWRELLLPALGSPSPPLLWPFDGPFRALLAPGGVAVAETYPAEALRHFGLKLAGSKRRQADRAALAAPLMAAMAALDAMPDRPLAAQVADGFGADAAGEDRLDCNLGLLCLLNVLAGHRPDTAPADPWIQRWEGWVLGQTALPSTQQTTLGSAP